MQSLLEKCPNIAPNAWTQQSDRVEGGEGEYEKRVYIVIVAHSATHLIFDLIISALAVANLLLFKNILAIIDSRTFILIPNLENN